MSFVSLLFLCFKERGIFEGILSLDWFCNYFVAMDLMIFEIEIIISFFQNGWFSKFLIFAFLLKRIFWILQYHPLQRLSIYTPIVNSIGHGSSGVTDIRSSSFDASNMYSLFRTLLKLRNNHENRKKIILWYEEYLSRNWLR